MNKEKKLKENIFLMALGQFSSKILVFLLVPLYTSILTPAEYGVYDILITIVSLFTPFLTLLISEAVMRFCLDKDVDSRQVLSIGVYTVIIGTVVMLLVTPVFNLVETIKPYKWWITVFFVVSNLYSVLTQYLKGVERVKLYTICGILSTVFTIFFNLLFLLVFELRLMGYIFAYVLTHILLILIIFAKGKTYRQLLPLGEIKKGFIKEMLAYSAPMLPNSISWWINNSADKYMLMWFVDMSAVGIYSVAHKIPSMLTVVIGIFMSAWQISVVEDFGTEEGSRFFNKTYNRFVVLNILACAFLVTFSKPIGALLFAREFSIAWKYSMILIIGSSFHAISGFLGSVFTTVKKTKVLFHSTFCGALLNIVLNAVLISFCGIMGAVVATSASYVFTYIIRRYSARKYIKIKTPFLKYLLSYILVLTQSFLALRDTKLTFVLTILILLGILLCYRQDILALISNFRKKSS